MVAKNRDGSENLVEVGGYYHHALVPTAPGWRWRELVEELVWKRNAPETRVSLTS